VAASGRINREACLGGSWLLQFLLEASARNVAKWRHFALTPGVRVRKLLLEVSTSAPERRERWEASLRDFRHEASDKLLVHNNERLGPAIFSLQTRNCASENQNSLADASRAPSLRVRSFARTTSGATRPHPAEVSKPQSFAASTAEASPITAATRSIRSDITSGCSIMFVSGSITPATRICPDFSGSFSKQRNS